MYESAVIISETIISHVSHSTHSYLYKDTNLLHFDKFNNFFKFCDQFNNEQ